MLHTLESNFATGDTGPRSHGFPRDPGECPVQGPQKLSEELEPPDHLTDLKLVIYKFKIIDPNCVRRSWEGYSWRTSSCRPSPSPAPSSSPSSPVIFSTSAWPFSWWAKSEGHLISTLFDELPSLHGVDHGTLPLEIPTKRRTLCPHTWTSELMMGDSLMRSPWPSDTITQWPKMKAVHNFVCFT